MAHLTAPRTRADGTLAHRVKYRPSPGAREKVVTFDDPTEAKRWCDLCNLVGPTDALRALQATAAATVRPSVAQIVDDHIRGLSGIEPATREDYQRDLRLYIQGHALGGFPAEDLTRRDVGEWINWMEGVKGRSAKTIKNKHALLSDALSTAVQEGRLRTNVAKGVGLPDIKTPEMVFLEPAELRLILNNLHTRWHPLILLLVGTGLRWGEATALRIGDVDFAAGTLRVTQAWKRPPRGEKRLGAPKTEAGGRTVEIPPNTLDAVLPLAAGRPGTAHLLVNTLGRPIQHGTFYLYWKDARTSAQEQGLVKNPRIHDLRHTFASWALNDGVPIWVLSRVMGHKNASVTTDRYGHLQPDRISLVSSAVGARISQALA